MILFPFTRRDVNGKIIGNFAAIQREQLLAFRKAGLARGPLYVGMCLQVDFPFADRPFEICVEKFCKRWSISRSQYYLALEKLRKANFLSIVRSKIFLCFNNPGKQNPIPENENPIPENENPEDPKPLTDKAFSDSRPQTITDFNKDDLRPFSDSSEVEKETTSDLWVDAEIVETEQSSTPVESASNSFVDQPDSSSGLIFPAPKTTENYTQTTRKVIARYEESGVIPKGMELIQWASEAIGGDVQLYRQSGRILSFKPNDIDKNFLKFLETRLTQNKKGMSSNPTAWINAMERDPSRWGELSELVGAWQREKFLQTKEGKAVKTAYESVNNPFFAKYREWQ